VKKNQSLDEVKKIACDFIDENQILKEQIKSLQNMVFGRKSEKTPKVEHGGLTVSIARNPEKIIPKSIATPGLLAHILTGKFADALPFYRQEKQFTRIGIELGRSTMCKWAMVVASACELLIDLMKKDILAGPLIGIDETPLQVLKGPRKSKSYMWVYRGGTPDKPIVLFEYHPTRSGDVASIFLYGYQGIVQTDGYIGYDFLDKKKGILYVGCWLHARRTFKDVTKAGGNKSTATGNAASALKYISKFYKIEKDVRQNELSPKQLYEQRESLAIPILKEFKKLLDARVEKVPPKSLLGKAIHYTLSQWHRLTQYTKDRIIRPDNNLLENAIRPFVVGRKNWLFSDTVQGANTSAQCAYL